MDLDSIKKMSEEIVFYKKWFRTYSSNGVKIIGGDGRTFLILKKENILYYLCIEPLCTKPLSWWIDWDSLAIDKNFHEKVIDENLKKELLASAISYFHYNKYLVADIDNS